MCAEFGGCSPKSSRRCYRSQKGAASDKIRKSDSKATVDEEGCGAD